VNRPEWKVRAPVPWATKDEIERRNNAAESAYRTAYGDRGLFVHLLIRGDERKTQGYAISPERGRFTKYSNNITVFCTVDAKLNVSMDGWLFHKEMQDAPRGEIGTRIVVKPLHPMEEFSPMGAK